jgi:hypothetical protein
MGAVLQQNIPGNRHIASDKERAFMAEPLQCDREEER